MAGRISLKTSVPYRNSGVKAMPFLTGFTLWPGRLEKVFKGGVGRGQSIDANGPEIPMGVKEVKEHG
jgi:hypothetical protein